MAGLSSGSGVAGLGFTEWTMGSSVVVSVTGEIDIATTDQLTKALGAALWRGPEGLICDLSGVGFLGAAGLTTLLVARRRAIACHAWFDLACPQPLPRKVITLVGLDAVFSLHDSVAEAAAAQARREGHPGYPPDPGPLATHQEGRDVGARGWVRIQPRRGGTAVTTNPEISEAAVPT